VSNPGVPYHSGILTPGSTTALEPKGQESQPQKVRTHGQPSQLNFRRLYLTIHKLFQHSINAIGFASIANGGVGQVKIRKFENSKNQKSKHPQPYQPRKPRNPYPKAPQNPGQRKSYLNYLPNDAWSLGFYCTIATASIENGGIGAIKIVIAKSAIPKG
jgi:hypothetical protein